MRPRPLHVVAVLAAVMVARPVRAQEPDMAEAPALGEQIKQWVSSLMVPHERFTNSSQIREVFRPVIARAREATVEIRSQGKRVAYGGVVGPDGWVLTKASVLFEPVTVRLDVRREVEAKVVGVDTEADLAMLKIDAKGLATLDLSGGAVRETTQAVSLRNDADEPNGPKKKQGIPVTSSAANESDLHAGDWLATVGLGHNPVAVGVVSVLARPIEKSPGFLGVAFNREPVKTKGSDTAVEVTEVRDDSAALEAGLQTGDLILSVDNSPTHKPEDLQIAIGNHHPGDRIELEVARGEEKLRLVATLRSWAPNPGEQRAHYQNRLGGELSERRFGFPSALQHDTVLTPDECGGPVVDLDGRVVAFNIARAGRTETYALPVSDVRSRLLDLMSGRMAPVELAD
ncbi:putative periplasmic serine endoprotease DegP-like precursor [Botrimarina colliarenosi]|uniref:Putative periplasmic serine endoprotease DegP-like n=1 Tax=Botrimarina colliarenosi TaxID=2528001 RepID=A0A5C6AAH1_9BACT|nr:PDZ domain-containing protein [Botrimarina colliarenosi]TWT97032.1 putative periplasmic serine endoprotease DegP-like precursor [Botrimarina colliarenosi]